MTATSFTSAERIPWPEDLPKAIAFDVDGTLSDNRHVMKRLNGRRLRGSGLFGIPNKIVIRTMRAIRKLGYDLAIYTARAQSEEGALKRWLKKHKVPYDHLWLDRKPPFILLVDDRAVDVQRKTWVQDLRRKLLKMSIPHNGKRKG